MRARLLLAALLTLAGVLPAAAAARFWVPIAVSGAADNGSGLCRLTTALANGFTGKINGESVTVASIVGATECNGTFTVVPVDSTHIDLTGSTFTAAYVSGGTVSGGQWDGTNIGNWGTTTGGTGGSAVPVAADTVTLDGASGGATVTVNATIAVSSITMGAFTGTLDFSAHNNSVTLTATTGFSGTGTGVRTLNMGNGTWTLSGTGSGNIWDNSTSTNLTINSNSSTILINGSTATARSFVGGTGLSYTNLTVSNGSVTLGHTNTYTGTVTVNGAASGVGRLFIGNGKTETITTLVIAGTAANQVLVSSDNTTVTATISVASGTPSITWAGFLRITCTGGATFTASNSFNLGSNSGITITPPSGGTGGGIIGG